eukprot:scaffold9618_cov123-Isochrysis_galbana.AAC.9
MALHSRSSEAPAAASSASAERGCCMLSAWSASDSNIKDTSPPISKTVTRCSAGRSCSSQRSAWAHVCSSTCERLQMEMDGAKITSCGVPIPADKARSGSTWVALPDAVAVLSLSIARCSVVSALSAWCSHTSRKFRSMVVMFRTGRASCASRAESAASVPATSEPRRDCEPS